MKLIPSINMLHGDASQGLAVISLPRCHGLKQRFEVSRLKELEGFGAEALAACIPLNFGRHRWYNSFARPRVLDVFTAQRPTANDNFVFKMANLQMIIFVVSRCESCYN